MGLIASLNISLWGARLWIWLLFVFSLFVVAGIVFYWNREKIRYQYYSFRFPEKLIKIMIHFKGNLTKRYYRLIPDDKKFRLDNKIYNYADKAVLKNSDFYLTKDTLGKQYFEIEGKKYDFIELCKIKEKTSIYPEIHYFDNNPTPITFNVEKKTIDFTSLELEEFEKNDLWKKLLTLEGEKTLMVFILILCIVNMVASLLIIAKMFGILDKK